jgi:putative peptidoglycan lipid II flippase
MKPLGVGGLALATSLCAYMNVFMLFYKLKQKIGKIGARKILISSLKALIASTIMGIIAYQIMQIKVLPVIIALIISIICSIISFIILLKILKSQEIEQILSGIHKKKNAKNS